MSVELDITSICDDESKKRKTFFATKYVRYKVRNLLYSIRILNIQCLYGLSRWKELEQNSDKSKSLMPQGYISNYIKIIETSVSFLQCPRLAKGQINRH